MTILAVSAFLLITIADGSVIRGLQEGRRHDAGILVDSGRLNVLQRKGREKTICKILTEDSRPDVWRNVGDSIVMNCSVLSGGPARRIKWRKDRKRLIPSSVNQMWSTIVLSSIRASDAGLYKCIARRYTKDVSEVRLHVRVKPTIKYCTPNLTIVSGESFPFECNATGEPKPTFKWLKDGKPVVSKWGTVFMYVPRNNGMDLSIASAEKSEEGVYTCIAKNKLGEARCNVKLSILDERRFCYHPPEITAVQTQIASPTGNDVSISCVGKHADRAISFVDWRFGRKFIHRSHKYDIVNRYYVVGKVHYRVVMVNTTLTVKNVTAEIDSGTYSCQMISEYGDKSWKDVILNVIKDASVKN